MLRFLTVCGGLMLLALSASPSRGAASGDYLEMRTCAIYTGPCFANGQVGVTGHEAIMAWSIDHGDQQGVDLTGLRVVLALKASDTLAEGGGMTVRPEPIQSVVLVDERANAEQRSALVDFVRERAGKMAGEIVRVDVAPIAMKLDHVDRVADLQAGEEVSIQTRQLRDGDCVCSNEEIYYPPLAEVENSSPAFTLEGKFSGRGLGVKWSSPQTRSAFLATFSK